MALSSMLRKVLAQRVLETQEGDTIVLRECDPKSNMKVSLVNLSVPVVAIRLSKFRHLSVLRDGPWKQVCDYLLVYALNSDDYAVLIELKKSLSNESRLRSREQLRRSLPFLEYLRSVCDIDCGNESANSRMRIRYFLIAERASPRLGKQNVKVGPDPTLEREEYENIAISTFVTPMVSLATLSRA